MQDLERIQKNALRIILQDEYRNYSNALCVTGLKPLSDRRNELCIRFAKACAKNDQTKSMFPLNPTSYDVITRQRETFKVTKCNTKRFQTSAIPFMQNLLNTETFMNQCKKWNFVCVLKNISLYDKSLSLSLSLYWNDIRAIAHAQTYNEDDIFMQRRLV